MARHGGVESVDEAKGAPVVAAQYPGGEVVGSVIDQTGEAINFPEVKHAGVRDPPLDDQVIDDSVQPTFCFE